MDIEKRIVEERTTEATKKNLMGYQGKIFLVSKILGHEMIKESEGPEYLDFESIYEDNTDNDNIQTYSDDSYSYSIGHSFDGLSYGYHINIMFMEYENSIKLWYKGNICYHEEAGNLLMYKPHDEWEKIIDNLFSIAESRVEKIMKNKVSADKKSFAILKNRELQRIRDKWGDII